MGAQLCWSTDVVQLHKKQNIENWFKYQEFKQLLTKETEVIAVIVA